MKLDELGFNRYRSINRKLAAEFHSRTGYTLPVAYLEFLCFREPAVMPLVFPFIRADGEEWEGCASEFCNIAPHEDSLSDLAAQVIRPEHYPGRVLLPIGVDAGGNYFYLDFSAGEPTVVDTDYGTGAVSQIASDFASFVDKLRRGE